MDELLHERVKQLREIADRLDMILRAGVYIGDRTQQAIIDLKDDIGVMIARAEQEHADF